MDTLAAILGGRSIGSVLEVGCNRGHNLVALSSILEHGSTLTGIEPQPYARSLARQASDLIEVLDGTIYDIPFADRSFDLVLTSGVLIHVPLGSLGAAIRELHRVSRRYLLSIEYFADEETVIPYRGHDDLLWKRDFLAHFEEQLPTLRLLGSGDLTIDQGFDRARWWLLER